MASSPRFPSPPDSYSRDWGNQYTRLLELTILQLWTAIEQLQGFTAPSYTTAERTSLTDKAGQIVFDTDLSKLYLNTGAGWEEIQSM